MKQVEIEFEAAVAVQLTNTTISWFDNHNNIRTDKATKVYLDMDGNHRFCVKGGIVPMKRIKSIVYEKKIILNFQQTKIKEYNKRVLKQY